MDLIHLLKKHMILIKLEKAMDRYFYSTE